MTVTQNIRAALESQIQNVTGVPATANRAWENVGFDPTTGTTFIRVTFRPLNTRPATRGSNPQLLHEGLFLVDVRTPEGEGPAEADALADAIRDAYPIGSVLSKSGVNVRFRYAERAEGLPDPPWYVVPVTIGWYSYTQS